MRTADVAALHEYAMDIFPRGLRVRRAREAGWQPEGRNQRQVTEYGDALTKIVSYIKEYAYYLNYMAFAAICLYQISKKSFSRTLTWNKY
jgi:hypothetical protein